MRVAGLLILLAACGLAQMLAARSFPNQPRMQDLSFGFPESYSPSDDEVQACRRVPDRELAVSR